MPAVEPVCRRQCRRRPCDRCRMQFRGGQTGSKRAAPGGAAWEGSDRPVLGWLWKYPFPLRTSCLQAGFPRAWMSVTIGVSEERNLSSETALLQRVRKAPEPCECRWLCLKSTLPKRRASAGHEVATVEHAVHARERMGMPGTAGSRAKRQVHRRMKALKAVQTLSHHGRVAPPMKATIPERRIPPASLSAMICNRIHSMEAAAAGEAVEAMEPRRRVRSRSSITAVCCSERVSLSRRVLSASHLQSWSVDSIAGCPKRVCRLPPRGWFLVRT